MKRENDDTHHLKEHNKYPSSDKDIDTHSLTTNHDAAHHLSSLRETPSNKVCNLPTHPFPFQYQYIPLGLRACEDQTDGPMKDIDTHSLTTNHDAAHHLSSLRETPSNKVCTLPTHPFPFQYQYIPLGLRACEDQTDGPMNLRSSFSVF